MARRLDPDPSTETLDAAAIEFGCRAIEAHLSRSLPVVEVQRVHVGEVAARTGARGIADDLGGDEALFRITIRPPEEMAVLDTRSDVTGFIRRELATSLDQHTPMRDSELVATDMPPHHLDNEPLVYYLRTTL